MNFFGKQAAFEGDKTACGATLISSQTLATADVPFGSGGTVGNGLAVTHELGNSPNAYRGRFQVLGEQTGQPVAGHPYSFQTADGQTISGTTDDNGYTQWHEASEPASLVFGQAS